MNQNHEEIIKNLKDKEKSKDEYNTLDTDITEYQISNTALKLKLRKAVYSDKISNEMIKYSTDRFKKGLSNSSTQEFFPNHGVKVTLPQFSNPRTNKIQIITGKFVFPAL